MTLASLYVCVAKPSGKRWDWQYMLWTDKGRI